ncbi:hypothetical protein CFI00_02270 [Nocardioides sp. S5]|uniref:nidogen-like domain-containing protein n=1 Tax=Nocardioides sp. S5 TaxID=2017486 RepID=UPI001A8DBA76|nr:nidogen-like domain-containing protein [Nocardioides sp. S5]QSR29343.1 hypothetical protein CFI00_02270 [Nocardioides sp. S5]
MNNNGNVTFGSGLEQYTPSVLSGGTQFPIIAPFFADFDTTAEGSGLTTYGQSADGLTFCAQWLDLGYYEQHMDKTNSVQLVLQSAQGRPGRSPGDFDITFNYDRISWESGDASEGVAGLGGWSAAVGFSAGHGLPGSAFQMTGSFVNGAFLDGGPNALVSGSHGTTQPGRYVFEVRNAGFDLTPEPTAEPTATPPPVVVTKSSSSTSVRVSSKRIRAGSKVRVTVKVATDAAGSRTGSVRIKDGRKVVKRIAKLSSSGKARVTLKNVKRGTHRIRAVFSGNATTLGSTSKVVRLRAR